MPSQLFVLTAEGTHRHAGATTSTMFDGVVYWPLQPLSDENSGLLHANGAIQGHDRDDANLYILDYGADEIPVGLGAPLVDPAWIRASVLAEKRLSVRAFNPRDDFCGVHAVFAGMSSRDDFEGQCILEEGGGTYEDQITLLTTHAILGRDDQRLRPFLLKYPNCPVQIWEPSMLANRHYWPPATASDAGDRDTDGKEEATGGPPITGASDAEDTLVSPEGGDDEAAVAAKTVASAASDPDVTLVQAREQAAAPAATVVTSTAVSDLQETLIDPDEDNVGPLDQDNGPAVGAPILTDAAAAPEELCHSQPTDAQIALTLAHTHEANQEAILIALQDSFANDGDVPMDEPDEDHAGAEKIPNGSDAYIYDDWGNEVGDEDQDEDQDEDEDEFGDKDGNEVEVEVEVEDRDGNGGVAAQSAGSAPLPEAVSDREDADPRDEDEPRELAFAPEIAMPEPDVPRDDNLGQCAPQDASAVAGEGNEGAGQGDLGVGLMEGTEVEDGLLEGGEERDEELSDNGDQEAAGGSRDGIDSDEGMVQSGQESGADGDSDYEDGYEDDSEWNESASIVLSGIKLDKETKKALKDLGGNLTTQWGNCTHLVANNVKTSEKFLCSFGNAAFVVTQEWVTDSVQAGRLLGPKGYALSDPAAENKYGFSIRRSRALAVQSKGWLFEGRKFILSGSFSEGEAHNLNEIVKFFGGTCQRLTSPPSKRALETGFAIAMLKDLSTSGWARLAQEGSVWGRDMIIRCILQQKVDPEDDLRLPRPPSPSLELY